MFVSIGFIFGITSRPPGTTETPADFAIFFDSFTLCANANVGIFKDNNLVEILNENIGLLKRLDNTIQIKFDNKDRQILFNSDKEQLGRAFFNLIKNSIESIQQKSEKTYPLVMFLLQINYLDHLIVSTVKLF